MNEELKELIAKTKNPDALGRLLRYAADRLDEIVAERRREGAARKTAEVAPDAR